MRVNDLAMFEFALVPTSQSMYLDVWNLSNTNFSRFLSKFHYFQKDLSNNNNIHINHTIVSSFQGD